MSDSIAADIWVDCYHCHNSIYQGGNMVDTIIDQASSFLRVSGLKERVYKFVFLQCCCF